MVDARAGSELVSAPSALGVLSAVNGYPKRSTLGACVLFCFSGTGLGTGVPPSGPPPAVHRDNGMTALHWAAEFGNRRIVRSLAAFNADVNAQNHNGCAVCACGESAVSAPAESPPPSAVQVDAAARGRGQWRFRIRRGAAAARRRRGRPGQQRLQRVPLRCAAQPKPKTAAAARAQAHAEAMGGR